MPRIDNQRLTEFWSIMREYNRLAQDEFMELYRKYQGDEAGLIRALQLYMPEIASQYRALAAETGMLFYADQDFKIDEQMLATAGRVNVGSMESTLETLIKQYGVEAATGYISGMLQRNIIQGARNYGLDSLAEDQDIWWRAARPGCCSFCKMLATRAYYDWQAYKSFKGAGGGDEFKYHENCYCVPVRGSHYDMPDHVKDWASEYRTATDAVGNSFDTNEILNVMAKIDRGTFDAQAYVRKRDR